MTAAELDTDSPEVTRARQQRAHFAIVACELLLDGHPHEAQRYARRYREEQDRLLTLLGADAPHVHGPVNRAKTGTDVDVPTDPWAEAS